VKKLINIPATLTMVVLQSFLQPAFGVAFLTFLTMDPVYAEVKVRAGSSAPDTDVLIAYTTDIVKGYQWKENNTGSRKLGQSFRSPENAVMNSFSLAVAGNIQPGAGRAPFTVTIYESDNDTALGTAISIQKGLFLSTSANPVNPGWMTFEISEVNLTKGLFYTVMLSWDKSGVLRQEQSFLHSDDGAGFSLGRLWQANNGAAAAASSVNDLLFSVQISKLIEDDSNPSGCEITVPAVARFIAVERENYSPDTWFRISNREKESRTITVELELSGVTSNIENRTWQQEITLNPGEAQDVKIPADDLPVYGIYQLSYRLNFSGATTEWNSDTFCVYPKNRQPAPGESAMPIGFASGAPRCTPRMLELAASLGFEFYRFNIPWNVVQPTADTWNWQTQDDYINLIQQYNLRWHVLSTWSVLWAAAQRSDPPEPEAWRNWISAVASRYKNVIEFWEVWNEPDLATFTGTVDDYTRTQRIAHDAIKAVDSNLVVTSGGYASLNHWATKPGAFDAAIGDYPRSFDWFAYHMHDTFQQFYNDIHKQLATIQQKYNAMDMPFVFTETGYDTRNGEYFQAETLMKKMSYAASIGAKSYCWYNIIDRSGRDAPQQTGKTFGLITNPTGTDNFIAIEEEFRPKESFVAAATAVAELRRLPLLATWLEDEGVYAFLFGKAGDCLVTGWREDKLLSVPALVVKNNGAAVTALDLFGNPVAVPSQDGFSLLTLNAPRYFKFSGGTVPEYLQPLISVPEDIIIGSDDTVEIQITVWNPLSWNIKVIPAFRGNDDIQIISAPAAQTVVAGSTAVFPVRISMQPGKLGDSTALYAAFNFEGTGWAPEIEIPVPFNVLDARKGATILLDKMEQVRNKQDNDPSTLHLLWGSPVDLSVQADFSINAATNAVIMIFTVKDNALYAVPHNEPLIDGDALEIAWSSASNEVAHLVIAAEPGEAPRMQFRKNGANASFVQKPEVSITRSEVKQNWNFPYTKYEVIIGFKDLGLTKAGSIRFNFAVHDNDGEGAKSWISAAPGLGSSEISADGFFVLRVK